SVAVPVGRAKALRCLMGSRLCHEVDCPTIAPRASRVKVPKCRVGFWLCLDQTQCVSFSHVCDGEKDCQDGSDEEECDEVNCPTIAPPVSRVKMLKCRVGFQLCWDGTECVPYSHVCDGEKDCQDGSDESLCGMSTFSRRLFEFVMYLLRLLSIIFIFKNLNVHISQLFFFFFCSADTQSTSSPDLNPFPSFATPLNRPSCKSPSMKKSVVCDMF
uniref:Uncharacterized protein n=1 Tax=Hippocampus comes TaxID=109280 RepID=A0A3Q2YP89_HIPCM